MRLHFLSSSSCLALLLCVFATAAQSGSVSLHPGVSSSANAPTVKVTVDQQRVPVGTQVTFTLSPASVVSDPLYTVTLFFGDGQEQLMKKAQTVHVYSAVGNYTYSILVKRSDGTNQPPARVMLTARSPIEEGEAVDFSASVSPPRVNLQYRFMFGDGESSGWQAAAQSNHVYRARGVYLARVEVGTSGRALAVSALRQVKVTPPPSVSVSLVVTPPQPPAGETVTLRARVSPANPNTQYRFVFGDGQQSFWQVEPLSQHVYKTAGRYPASVEVTQSDSNRKLSGRSTPTLIAVQKPVGPTPTPSARPTPQTNPSPGATPTSQTSPTPTSNASPSPTDSPTSNGSPSPGPAGAGSPSITGVASPVQSAATLTATDSPPPNGPLAPKNLWKYLLIAAILLFLIYKASGLLFAAQPTFAAVSDPGASDLSDRKAGLPVDFQLVLNPNVSTGEYKIQSQGGSLVQNADRLSGREILEL